MGKDSRRTGLRPGARPWRALTGAALFVAACGQAAAEDPAQWWDTLAARFDAPGGAVEIGSETRVAEGADVLLWNGEAVWLFTAGPRLSIGPGYKYEAERRPGGHFLGENRYLLMGKIRLGEPAGWTTGLRILHEERHREGMPRAWRGRLRGEARRGMGGSSWGLDLRDELFFDSGSDSVSQNRLMLGAGRPIGGRASLTLQYMLRSDRRDRRWESTHVLVTGWSFKLRVVARRIDPESFLPPDPDSLAVTAYSRSGARV